MSQSSNETEASELSLITDNYITSQSENNMDQECNKEDDAFVWQDYLDVTHSVEVPAILFNHVEQSLLNGLAEGMAMEVPLKDPTKFWLATIVMACGPLLRMRYLGDPGDDRTKEFWCDLTKVVVHPVGWCESQDIDLTPPEELQHRLTDIADLVDKLMSEIQIHAPEELLSGIGLAPADRIKPGMKIEIQDKLNPHQLWSGTIVENVGGRIFCRYDDSGPDRQHFWEFYSSPRIFKAGYAAERGPPWALMTSKNCDSIENIKEENLGSSLPSDLFQHKHKPSAHEFKVGMKVVAVNPENMSEICLATVTEVFDSEYFLVRLDTYKDGSLVSPDDAPTWMCTKDHPYILPVAWAESHNLSVSAPRGWPRDQRWTDHQFKMCAAAPRSLFPAHANARAGGFRAGMKLEAVNPRNHNEVCAATVQRTVDRLLVLTLECFDSDAPNVLASMDALDIFPVGWCESNGYPITPPRFYKIPAKSDNAELESDPQKPESLTPSPSPPLVPAPRSAWCPKIYFNHKCFTGLLLSKGKLAMLPRSVGPGPVTLVMHEVLGMVVATGYLPIRVLKILRLDGTAKRGMHAEVHKAKYKGTSYSASVAVITSADKVADFCRSICVKLQICPYLFGPLQVPVNNCPNKCHTFSKSTGLVPRNVVESKSGLLPGSKKKKKVRKNGVGGITATKRFQNQIGLEDDDKPVEKPPLTQEEFASLRLMVEGGIVGAENAAVAAVATVATAEGELGPRHSSISSASEIKRKYKRRAVPSTEMTTRGAQLPKFSAHWRRSADRRKNGAQPDENEAAAATAVATATAAAAALCSSPDVSFDKHLLKMYNIKLPKYPHAITLDSNPICWTEKDIYWFLKRTKDCAHLANICKTELIDGHSFMLLNLPTIRYHMNLSLSESLKLCRHVEDMKLAHYIQYVAECDS